MIVATFLYLLAMLLAYLGLLKVYVEQPYYVETPMAYEAPAYTTPAIVGWSSTKAPSTSW